MATREALGLMGRRQTFTLLVGIVAGLLVAGLAIPFVFGTPLQDAGVVVEGEPGAPVASGEAAGTAQPTATGGAQPADGPTGPGDGTSEGPESPQVAPPSGGGSEGADGQAAQSSGSSGEGAGGQSSASSDGSAGSNGSTGSNGQGLSATDRGVTAEKVKVGFLVLDVGNLATVGVAIPGADPEVQEEAWRAYAEEVNDDGGVAGGRKIEPVFSRFDPLSQDSMRASCLELTEDEEVFAVASAGGFQGPAALCVTVEHKTPLVTTGSSGMPQEYYRKSQGRLFTLHAGGDRAMRNFASDLDGLGALDGRTLGILTDDRPGNPEAADVLAQQLGQLGHEVAYTATLPSDNNAASSQVPVEVQRMRSNGVDGILKLVNVIKATQFVQEADSQAYQPQYYAADWQNASTDTYGQNMPSSYDGAFGITSVRTNEAAAGLPESDDAKRCREIYERRTGNSLERDSNEYYVTLLSCTDVTLAARAMDAAGADLTRPRFSSGMSNLGSVSLGNLAPGSFQPDKPDASDHLRTLRWRSDCSCYVVESEFRRVQF